MFNRAGLNVHTKISTLVSSSLPRGWNADLKSGDSRGHWPPGLIAGLLIMSGGRLDLKSWNESHQEGRLRREKSRRLWTNITKWFQTLSGTLHHLHNNHHLTTILSELEAVRQLKLDRPHNVNTMSKHPSQLAISPHKVSKEQSHFVI